MTEFARSPQARDDVKGQIHPATWLNDERYDDDPREWAGNARASPEPISEAFRKAEQIRRATRNAGMKARASEEKINQAIAKRLIEAGLENQLLPRERDVKPMSQSVPTGPHPDLSERGI